MVLNALHEGPLARRDVRWAVLGLYSASVLAIDYATGPSVIVLAWLVPPIVLAAWYDSMVVSFALAIGLPLVRLGFEFIWPNIPWTQIDSLLNFVIRATAMAALTGLVSWISRLVREVRVMRGLLPICMYCHKIRSAEGQWQKLEAYLTQNSDATLSHGMCPVCALEKTRS
jgi:hypothetical protein